MGFFDRFKDSLLLAVFLLVSLGVMLNMGGDVLYSLRTLTLNTTSRVEEMFSWVGRYLNALDENDRLRATNIDLSSKLARLREADLQNNSLKGMLKIQQTTQASLQAAQIVNKDITQRNNTFSLNVGTAQGVKAGMTVIDDRGLLGKVLIASNNFSEVQSYLNTGFKVAAKIQPTGTLGIVSWEGGRTDRLVMKHVMKTETIEKGTAVVTAGFNYGSYPAGITIGYIEEVSNRSGQNDLTIFLRPASPLAQAGFGFVVLSTPNGELNALQDSTKVAFGGSTTN